MNENQNEYVDINAHDNYPDSEQTIEIPTMKVIPLKKICMTIGELPTSYLETMSYYEMLVWFIEYLKNNIIPTINNNASAIQEVQSVVLALQNYINAYKDSIDSDIEELEEYMNNYFENLDVQDEINNKLDQMLEDGVLEQIIEQFLQLTSLICFDNVANMKASTNLANGSYAKTLGYYSKGDGGSALYKIRTITNDDVVDEMTILEIINDNTLIAELIIENNTLNINQLGAKNDGITDNKNYIEKAINISINKKIIISLMGGDYCYSGVISIPENQNGLTLIGSNEFTTKIKTLNNNSQLNFANFLRSKISNIRFEGTGSEEIPILYFNGISHLSEISNCTFFTNMGIFIVGSAYFKISDCSFSRHTTAPTENSYLLKCTSNGNEYLYLQNCYFEGNSSTVNCSPVQIAGGHNIFIDSCDFCNWYGGTGLKLGGSSSLKEITITNSTFVRNNHGIILQCDYGISNVKLDNNTFILLTGNETSIITNQRTSGSGVTSMVYGHNIIDANFDISEKTMLYTLSGLFTNGNLLFDSINNSFPDYTNGFPAYFNLNIPNNRVLSGSGETVNVTLSTKSPYKSYNLPDIKFFKYNGANPVSMDISNTYQGNLILTFNYASGTTNPYSEVQLRIKN